MKKFIIGLLVLTSLNVFGQTQRYRVEKTIWDTNWGDIELIRDTRNNKITGKYVATNGKFVGNYNSDHKKYSGKFYNGKLKRWGHFRFDVNGKAFRGKWGWSTALKGGSWNGSFKEKKIYVRAVRTEANTEPLKLKVTLTSIGAFTAWDGDNKDDYLLDFTPTLTINGKAYQMKHRKLARNEGYVKRYGKPSSLHVRRAKNQSHHAQVQLHTREKSWLTVGNSGIFEIPKSELISDSRTDLNLKVVVDEVSKETERILTINEKLNLPLILKYLNGERSKKAFSKGSDQITIGYLSNPESHWKQNMGSGYRDLYLTQENGKRVIKDNVIGYKMKKNGVGLFGQEVTTQPMIAYTIELVD